MGCTGELPGWIKTTPDEKQQFHQKQVTAGKQEIF